MNTFEVTISGVIVTLVFTVICVIVVMDSFLYFPYIEKQCIAQGYIQNNTTRITCQVEGKT